MTINALYHEVIHILLRKIFRKQSIFDEVLDNTNYYIDKLIYLKNIVKERGWRYFKNSSIDVKKK